MANRKGFVCKQCGECCRIFWLTESKADWEKIVDFIKREYDGVLVLEYDFEEPTVHFIESVDDLPWIELDECSCPFFRRLRAHRGRFTSKFYCEIHEFKPEACNFFPADKEHAKNFCDCPGYD